MMEPGEGILTFRAEGNNITGSQYYSREIHYPGNRSSCSLYSSGVTIGRGYDLGSRHKFEVISDLTLSGVNLEKAKMIAEGVGLTGCKARDFVKKNREKIGEITEYQQKNLFERIYRLYKDRARVNYVHWVGSVKGAKKWDELSLPVKNVLVDFVYNGYTKSARPMIAGSNNDINELILYIKKTPVLMNDEAGRNRIKYLEMFR